jgi:hypothetical protein
MTNVDNSMSIISNDNTTELVEIYKGKYFSKQRKSRAKRVVVFDFDETLGSFVDLEILWAMINRYKHTIEFNDVLDIYQQEFVRYGIMPILEYLFSKKTSGECYKVYVYTNNKAEKPWVQLIINYFNHKISRTIPLFDQIIHAFKINNIHTELNRTTHKKTYNDFINCTLLPQTTAICFIDDVFYKDMKTERLYYIKPKPYKHRLSTHDIISRFIYSKVGNDLLQTDKTRNIFKSNFVKKNMMIGNFKTQTNYSNTAFKNDILVAQKIMYHLKEFFYIINKRTKTCKNRKNSFSFTRKRSVK